MAFWLRMGNRGTFVPAQSASGEKGKLRKGECEAGLCQAVDFSVGWKAGLR